MGRVRAVERAGGAPLVRAEDDRVGAQQQRQLVQLPPNHAPEPARRPTRWHPGLPLLVAVTVAVLLLLVVVVVVVTILVRLPRRAGVTSVATAGLGRAHRIAEKPRLQRLAMQLEGAAAAATAAATFAC